MTSSIATTGSGCERERASRSSPTPRPSPTVSFPDAGFGWLCRTGRHNQPNLACLLAVDQALRAQRRGLPVFLRERTDRVGVTLADAVLDDLELLAEEPVLVA